MIDTKALRSRVLDLAIQGKLTEQLESDGTAEELWQKIQAEKQRFIKEGKLKKEKPLPEISQEEIPFEIPENWKWVRLGDIIAFIDTGKSIKCIETPPKPDEVGIVRVSAVSWGVFQENESKTCINAESFNEKYLIKQDDFLISRANTTELVGACVIVEQIKKKLMLSDKILRLNLLSGVYNYFLLYALRSSVLRAQIEIVATGTSASMKNISQGDIKNLVLFLPPLAEQKRIVARVEEIFRLLDTIDAAQEQYAADAESLKAKLITLGIQGRLTEQLESDGTAEELYQQIQAEKQRLIKEGKIKREKPLPEITPDEIPFEIPENWKWVRLKTVLLSASTGPFGSMLHKSDYAGKGVPLINPADIVNSAVSTQKIKKVAFQKAEEMQSYRLVKGNIVIGRRGEMGRAAIITETEEGFLCGTGCFFIMPSEGLFAPYFIRLLQTNEMRECLRQGSVGSTMDNLNHSILENLPIPLPPLAEQKRIAETLERVLGVL